MKGNGHENKGFALIYIIVLCLKIENLVTILEKCLLY